MVRFNADDDYGVGLIANKMLVVNWAGVTLTDGCVGLLYAKLCFDQLFYCIRFQTKKINRCQVAF